MSSEDLVDGQKPIYHIKMEPDTWGISDSSAKIQDMADEYAIVQDSKANAGLIVYGKYNGVWRPNPWSTRFLIRDLLSKIGIEINT